MNVGFLSTRLAGTDGVSLETAKIAELVERMGHRAAYCAGELDAGGPDGQIVDEMHFRHPEIRAIHDAAFRGKDSPELLDRIAGSAGRLRRAIRRFIDGYAIDVLVSENASTIPMNIPLGVALSQETAASAIPCIAHHHDFAWERERFEHCAVQNLLDLHFPPDGPTIRHAVISTVARQELLARRGIDSVVLPNVMDFAVGPAARSIHSRELRTALGFGEDVVVLLQPTRVVPRKGIEHAIELASRLADACRPRPVRLLVSHPAGDEGTEYLDRLRRRAVDSGVELAEACDLFVDCRDEDDSASFDLRDAYECADLVTYPSLLEGFGNALLEAVFHRKPLLVNRYPVYVADVSPCGFDFIEIDGQIHDRTVGAVAALLENPGRVREMTDHNYGVARRYFSYEVAQERLVALLESSV